MNRIVVQTQQGDVRISRHIYGHFSEHLGRCIYGGFWVGEDSPIPNIRGIRTDVVQALKRIRVPNLRWPGGCFADEYHWRDGIGPKSERPKMINTHWGGVVEDNSFGTHEFLDLCGQLDCEPYICGNVGSGTVQELSQWVEYVNFSGTSPMTELRRSNGRPEPWAVKYWGVGNENWGCGGQMSAEYYADLYRRYATYCRSYDGGGLYKIACGPRNDDYHWTETLMKEATRPGKPQGALNGLALHYYTVPGERPDRGSATEFNESEWAITMKKSLHMGDLVENHCEIMDRHDPSGQVDLIVDEWGTWYDVEPGTEPGFLYQQNTLRDALVAGTHLNIFNNRCDRIHMANLAQTVNVLQALVLTDDDAMVLTPTYHVFDMYKVHQDALRLPVHVECDTYSHQRLAMPALNASASEDETGRVSVTICNVDHGNAREARIELRGMSAASTSAIVLTASQMSAYNDFRAQPAVAPKPFDDYTLDRDVITVTVPPKSVLLVQIDANR